MTLREQLSTYMNDKTPQHDCVENNRSQNYKCSICAVYFCEVFCWFKHLFWHWRNNHKVTGWYDIRKYGDIK